MQEYVVKMIILILAISILTDHYKVAVSHYVPCSITYRLTLLYKLYALIDGRQLQSE